MAEALGRETSIRRRPEVLHRELAGESILLDPRRGTYFGLNEVATVVWRELAEPTTLGALHDVLLASFDVPAERLWIDLTELARDLDRLRLVELTGPAPTSPPDAC